MAKYRVSLSGYADFTVVVDAEDEEAAVEAAYEEIPSLCAHCSGWTQPWDLALGEGWDREEPTVEIANDR